MSSVFGGSSSTTAVPGKFTFGSGASISSGFNFGTTPTKLESAASPSGAAGESGKTFGTGTSLLAQMLMSGTSRSFFIVKSDLLVFVGLI